MMKKILPALSPFHKFGFALVPLLMIVDQVSKWAVMELTLRPATLGDQAAAVPFFRWLSSAAPREFYESVALTPFLNLVSVWNTGISFGLLKNDSVMGPYILVLMAVVISGVFGLWMVRSAEKCTIVALAMVIGGAVGNIIDRLRFGAVFDFIDFHAAGVHYPAFNVADSCITLGIAYIIIDGLFLAPKREKKARSDARGLSLNPSSTEGVEK